MGQHETSVAKPHCRYCEKELHGRLGKIFCNVDCKNNYNSRIRSAQRAEENQHFPRTIKAIKNNYRILLNYDLKGGGNGETMVKKSELEKQGFKEKYCTGAIIRENKLWKYCFCFCWYEQTDWLYLRYDPYYQ